MDLRSNEKSPLNHLNSMNNVRSSITSGGPKEFTAAFDYVIVFPMVNGEQSPTAKDVIHELIAAGLEVFPYLSVQEDELLVLFRCPSDILRSFTDKIDYKLKIDPATLERTLLAGDPEKRIAPIKITHDPNISPYTPYEHIFLKYDEDFDQSLYFTPPGETGPFVKSVRLKLVSLLLRAPKRQGGCDLEISKLIHKKRVLAMFPLHDRTVSDQILERCFDLYTMPWNVPVHDIREYFGEKIALYNVFLGHYSLWLVVPSIIGLIFQLVVWGTLDFSSPVLPFYSLLITVWSVFMLEYWKRQESTTALLWGMTDYEQLEQDRPEFRGDIIKSYINGRDFTYYPPQKYRQLVAISQTVITSFVTLVIGVVAAIYVFRFFLQNKDSTSPYSSLVASVLNTVQITVFNMIYQVLAKVLTDRENHRTDTLYEDSLIVKMFVFQFINSYASFFFLAFIAGNLDRPNNAPSDFLGQCGATNCMEPLSINLAIIFGSRLTITNFLDVFIPWLTYKNKVRSETKGIAEDKELSPAEVDYMLMQYQPMLQSIQNYADTAVQYGFTLLFITALPCASFFSLVNNYVKVKFNAWKLVTFYQRPIPSGAQDIGTWQSIFSIISVVSVITNAGLICFTMDVLWDYSLFGRVWIFIGFQWVLIFCQFLAQFIVPDVPEEVIIQEQRMQFINEKVIEKVEDEDFGELADAVVIEDEEDTFGAHAAKGCCNFGGKSRHRKTREGLDAVPVLVYPFNKVPNAWPMPLNKEDNRLTGTASSNHANGAAQAVDTTNYTSQYAAVYRGPEEEPKTTQNPVSYY